jgi:indole-3-glycerol phosphate synthase
VTSGAVPEDLLARLVAQARVDLERRRHLIGEDVFERSVADYSPKDFAAALRSRGLSIIAEMKQRTPSRGVLTDDYQPADLARRYAEGGAVALSVLTHMAGFGGRPEHVVLVREATELPVLRKDFITDDYEIAEARASGADAVLLIAAALEPEQLGRLLAVARSRGVAAVVEVHDERELQTGLTAGAGIIGINHRNLRTFEIDLTLTERLRRGIPAGVIVVAESGIHTADDARRMRDAGADAILVGEELMRAHDPSARIRELTAWSA